MRDQIIEMAGRPLFPKLNSFMPFWYSTTSLLSALLKLFSQASRMDFNQASISDIAKSILFQGATFLAVSASLVVLRKIVVKYDSSAHNWQKQIKVLAHVCRHFARQAIEAVKSAVCSQEDATKERSLFEGLGAISHVLCVVVGGRTELFITLRQQLLKSAQSPRLIRQQSSLSQTPTVVSTSQRGSAETPSRAPRHRPTKSGIPTPSAVTDKHTPRSHDGTQSLVIKSSSEAPASALPRSRRARFQQKIVAYLPRRQSADKVKHPHAGLDSRLRSLSSPLPHHFERGRGVCGTVV
ncbi:hypothetical protein V8F20_005994 [Naviculisporaceae sp. PSN 640]